MPRVEWDAPVSKQLKKLDPQVLRQIQKAINFLRRGTLRYKRLTTKPGEPQFVARSGDYRIIFERENHTLIITDIRLRTETNYKGVI